MSRRAEVTYKGFVFVALTFCEQGLYSSMLVTRDPHGAKWASGTLGTFACESEAERFAIQYGMAEVDHRSTVEPVPSQQKPSPDADGRKAQRTPHHNKRACVLLQGGVNTASSQENESDHPLPRESADR